MFSSRSSRSTGKKPIIDPPGNDKKKSRLSLRFGDSASKSSISNDTKAPPFEGPAFDFRDGFQPRSTDIFIAVMGVTGAGKSTFISLLTEKAVNIGHALQACTQEVEVYQCRYSDTVSVILHGIIYLHRITDRRMQGSAKKNFRMFKQLCGEDAAKNVILATTMWEDVALADAEKREAELINTPDFWGFMINKGSQVRRHMNTKESAMRLIHIFASTKSSNHPMTLAIQNEMVNENKGLDETAAGKEVEGAILKEREKWRKEFAETRLEMERALAAKDQESYQLLRDEQHKLRAHMIQSERSQRALKVTMETMHQEKFAALEKMFQQERKQHAEQLAAYQRQATLQNQRQMEEKIEQQKIQSAMAQQAQANLQNQRHMEERFKRQEIQSAQAQETQARMFAKELETASAAQKFFNEQKRNSETILQRERKRHAEQLATYQQTNLQNRKHMEEKIEMQRIQSVQAQREQEKRLEAMGESHSKQIRELEVAMAQTTRPSTPISPAFSWPDSDFVDPLYRAPSPDFVDPLYRAPSPDFVDPLYRAPSPDFVDPLYRAPSPDLYPNFSSRSPASRDSTDCWNRGNCSEKNYCGSPACFYPNMG
ncbi:hypothetical protein N7517_002390 [Penicillium concentricum]|uniref:G domain-containing protein n=1 Tax=Penicillium concentricum TaxID=293559 RepID=A0A9W9SVD3_9EURO|nr:uncharacterized protein N7517_002390 [Penicillium concentricum]KAJ5384479.1 hypothetical protein N7517_002390 [Penicillium concentricum]